LRKETTSICTNYYLQEKKFLDMYREGQDIDENGYRDWVLKKGLPWPPVVSAASLLAQVSLSKVIYQSMNTCLIRVIQFNNLKYCRPKANARAMRR
jgi:hypothetical protein